MAQDVRRKSIDQPPSPGRARRVTILRRSRLVSTEKDHRVILVIRGEIECDVDGAETRDDLFELGKHGLKLSLHTQLLDPRCCICLNGHGDPYRGDHGLISSGLQGTCGGGCYYAVLIHFILEQREHITKVPRDTSSLLHDCDFR